ncbi:MAG: hypothetical protein EoVTN8_1219 [Fluviibacter phosphoraccumulans EoVTN8]
MNPESDLHSVYLSGNGSLVSILRKALARDKISRMKLLGEKLRKGKRKRPLKHLFRMRTTFEMHT